MPERVLQLLGPSTGGIRRHVAHLAECLPLLGWSVAVAGPPGVMRGVGPQQHDVAVPWGRQSLKRAAREADVVHAHGLKAGWLAASLRGGPPVVVSVHNVVLDEVRGRAAVPLRALERALPRVVDRVIAVSDDIAGRLRADNVVVIPPAGPVPRPQQPTDEVRRSLGVGADDFLVVAVARLHRQKDLPTLIAAVALLAGRGVPVRLAVVGEGPEEGALRARIADLGLGGTVVLAGPRPNAADELAAADAVAVSSSWESGPLVLVEAMLLGRPVVTTPVGLAPGLVADGETGLLVPIGAPEAMASALHSLYVDPVRAAALGEAGRKRVEERYGSEALVSRVADVYRAMLHA
ncbi:MAG TPA: glycosyltransferase family 4 protein [Acidimicrobiales bacterium]|nr:glycosyltransferase family 4 protein [Acidimicrobiales bacterium]